MIFSFRAFSAPFRRTACGVAFAGVLALPGCAGWLLGVDDNPSTDTTLSADGAANGLLDGGSGPKANGDGGGTVVLADGGVCAAERKLCGNACVLRGDPTYGCGALSCAPCGFANGESFCRLDGQCALGACDSAHNNCDGQASNGCESTAATDPVHCGRCGSACANGEVCSLGTCALSCAGALKKCGNACVDTTSDAAHCGNCNAACTAPTAGTGAVACVASRCKTTCANGYRLAGDNKSCELIPVPTCGNGVRDQGETCDDSNALGGDGCSASCQAEPLYICTGAGPGSCVLSPKDWAQQAYIKASNTGAGDVFGHSVALSADGNTLAIGAINEESSVTGVGGAQSDNGAVDSGAVYVFARTGASWAQQAYVKASNTGMGDLFGFAVALSADGNTVAVGARFEDSSSTGVGGNQSDNSAGTSGAVYVLAR